MNYTLENFEQDLIRLLSESAVLDTKENFEYIYNKAVEFQLPVIEMIRIANRILNPQFPINKVFVIEKLRSINLDVSKLNL